MLNQLIHTLLISQPAMKEKIKIIVLLLVINAFFLGIAIAQNRKSLEDRKKQVQTEIDNTKRILEETRNKKKESLGLLNTLRQLIKERQSLIDAIQGEIGEVEVDINTREIELNQLSIQLDREKKRYAEAIYQAYKSRNSYSKLAFIFASKNFNQALQRLKYLKKIGDYQQRLFQQIKTKKDEIGKALSRLQVTKQTKTTLLASQENEKKDLEIDKSEQQQVVKKLTGKEGELRKKLKEKRAIATKLDQQIKNAIKREIEKAKPKVVKKAVVKPDKGNTKTKTVKTAPEETIGTDALSVDFMGNRGLLPWPVEKGFISEGYGYHKHPDIPNITTFNNGINITSSKESNARSIFKGVVSAILVIPGADKTILIKHGNFYTVYSKLSEVFVTKGQAVDIKQSVGKIGEDENGQTIVHFEIWLNTEKQNPEKWLKTK